MKRFLRKAFWLWICWIQPIDGTLAAAPNHEKLMAGYAEMDITPELGVTMPGYFEERRASAVLDPLMAKALVLTKDGVTLAIIAMDLIGIDAPIAARIRHEVQEKTGIPAHCVFLHATHTHTGATVSEIAERLPAQAALTVGKALDGQVAETHVTLGEVEEKSVAFIRRYLMKDGTVRTNPGHANPEIVRPIGEIDPAVTALAFETARILLVSYGLHLDCIGGDKFSADYPHHLTVGVRESLGAGWNVIFLNACCGNVNHFNVKDPNQRSGYEESRRIGRILAKAALSAHKNAAPISIGVLGAKSETVPCPIRKVAPEDYQWAKEEMEKNPEAASKRQFNERTPERIIALAETKEKSHPAEIVVFRLGPIGLVGLPAEVFTENARDIKVHSLLRPTLAIGLVGGDMGYMPHARGYREGGYEATYASAQYAPETPVLWCETAARLIGELTREEP
ncbi:MAG: hypothetical protein AB1656_10705 [Candidatus Omnitrophota bacterium]